MSQSPSILIFGSTGIIGQYITRAVLAEKNREGSSLKRVVIFSSQSTVDNKKELLQKWRDQGAEVIAGDITKDEDVVAAYKNIDTVISAVGRNVIAEQINLIKLAESSPNIIRFFPSEYGTDIEYYPDESPHEKPHQLKLKVRKYIKDHVKRLEHTYLVTGPYADMYLSNGNNPETGFWDIEGKKAVLLGTGDDAVSFTTRPDVGKLLVAALLHPEASRNTALKVNSFTTTPNAIFREFEAQTGAKWTASYTSLAELKKNEKKAWEEERPDATVYTLRRIWTQGGTLYEKRDNAKIGDPEVHTLKDTVKGVLGGEYS